MLLTNDLGRHHAATTDLVQSAAMRVFASGWFVMGRELNEFETAFAAYCGASFARGVGNGTDAIEISLRAVGITSGCMVATVANAGFYTATALQAIGAHPLYIDVEEDTHLMALDQLERALSRGGVDAIVITHLYGLMHDMPRIMAIAERFGVPVVEDCAQAHGAMINGRRAGSFGDAAAFSFYPTKNLGAAGDGGAIVTSRTDVDEAVQRLRQYGWSGKYCVASLGGRNSRLDELQAAILAAKLPHLDAWNARRQAIARLYRDMIQHPRIMAPPAPNSRHVVHLYVVRVDGREGLRQHLRSCGVVADVHYPIPDTRQPGWPAHCIWPDLPTTQRLAGQVLSLPCFPELTDAEAEHVARSVNAW